jgi:hypothetical protein
MLCVCFVVVECKGSAKDLFMVVVSHASIVKFYNNSSSFNPSHPHILPSHHTHLTTLSLSRRQGQLPLMPCLNGQHRKPTTQGEEEMTPLSNKGSVSHRNVHIREHGYTYRLINSTECVHLEIHKIIIIDADHRLGWFWRLPTSAMPPYLEIHWHAETMRRSTLPLEATMLS